MRKFLAAAAAVLMCAGIAACNNPTSKLPKGYDECISEIRSGVYTASDAGTTVTVYTGERENPFAIDGAAGKRTAFTQIIFKPPTVISTLKYTFRLTDGSNQYGGEFTMHPFGTGYVAEIAKTMNAGKLQLEITEGENTRAFAPDSVRKPDMIDWQDAVVIAKNVLNEQIAGLTEGKTLKAEILVRLLGDPTNHTDDHYWYVAFAGADRTYAVLIDPITQEVLATKK
ncbi:MAG: hypothetical protein FWE62_04080 [Firmicutes bacterium]|nr:hypothetical protein [Bacillota bacterium]